MKESKQQPIAVTGLAVAGLGVVAALLWFFLTRSSAPGPSPDELAELALTAASKMERATAAVKLADYGEPATAALRRVLTETQDPDVAAACVEGIGKVWDYDSLDALINIVESGPPKVCARAAVVVSRMTGKDRRFRTTESPERRREIVAFMRSDWETIRNAPPDDVAELKRRLRESHEKN